MAVDLDAARAARREAKGKGPELTFGGEVFELDVEMPYEIVDRYADLREAEKSDDGLAVGRSVLAIMRLLLGERYEAFMAHRPSIHDLTAFAEGALAEYGFGPGESPASMRSSGNTTGRSRPTSVPSTG